MNEKRKDKFENPEFTTVELSHVHAGFDHGESDPDPESREYDTKTGEKVGYLVAKEQPIVGFTLRWVAKGIGNGEVSFCRDGKGVSIDNEYMSRNFVIKVLEHFVKTGTLKDTKESGDAVAEGEDSVSEHES